MGHSLHSHRYLAGIHFVVTSPSHPPRGTLGNSLSPSETLFRYTVYLPISTGQGTQSNRRHRPVTFVGRRIGRTLVPGFNTVAIIRDGPRDFRPWWLEGKRRPGAKLLTTQHKTYECKKQTTQECGSWSYSQLSNRARGLLRLGLLDRPKGKPLLRSSRRRALGTRNNTMHYQSSIQYPFRAHSVHIHGKEYRGGTTPTLLQKRLN